MADTKKMVLKNVRFDWVKVFAAEKFDDSPDSKPKFTICVLLPNDHPQRGEFETESARIAKAAFPKEKNLKLPLRSGDEDREAAAYKGHMFFNASATDKYPPQVFDAQKMQHKNGAAIADHNKVADLESTWDSGDWGNISVELYSFNTKGNKGCAVGINAVQFVRKGEPLGKKDSSGDFDVEQAEEIGTDENY